MKKIPLLAFTFYFSLLTSYFCSAQSKMNFGAALATNNASQQENFVSLLVQGTVSEIKNSVEQSGGEFIYSIGNIASIKIKAKDIKALSEKPFVKRIEAKNPFSSTQPLNDSMLVNNRVVAVHQGMSPLLQAYKGKDVVLGFIDTGIDYTHPDFQDSTGKTRIKFLWDQTLADSVPPQPYNYGQEWTGADIDNGLATAHLPTAIPYTGHGTRVASSGAGNGLAINNYGGVAQESDIIFVAADFNNLNSIIDGTNYIFAKADSLGKPCAINCSLGDYYGSHDGLNLEAQAIKSLITAKTGRSFSAAAGNCGTCAFHLGYTVSSTDTNFTWFNDASMAYIAMYADTNNFKNVQFAIGADMPGPNYSFRGNIPFSNILPHVGVLMFDTIWNGSNRLCTIQSYGDLTGGVYSMEYSITPDSTTYNWRLMTTGSGKFDEWSFDVVTANLADTTIYPALLKYKQPDLNSNIVSSFQCLDEVITVGSYINRNQWIDYDTVLQINAAQIPGDIASFSSRGPTRDGRIKPDVNSSGRNVIGSIVLSQFSSYAPSSLGVGGFHSNSSGTSLSSPCVAGIAGLYLQMDPGADWQEIKNAIINCAETDSFTTSTIPNNTWGYGKADAFAALTGCATSAGNNQHNPIEELSVYPNPFSTTTTIEINISGEIENTLLKIYDLVGKELKSFAIQNSGRFIFHRNGLTNGIYFCTLIDGEKIITTKKLIISE